MSNKKLTTDEVPEKFAEWLPVCCCCMGCPPEILPSKDVVAAMCRGKTYCMIWRGLMERVEPVDTVKKKKLQVFCDDMNQCLNANVLESVFVPEEFSLWREQSRLQGLVKDAETRLLEARKKSQHLKDKQSANLSTLSSVQGRLEGAERRAHFLRTAEGVLRDMGAALTETNSIAESMCSVDDGGNVEGKLDKCMKMLCNQSGGTTDVNKTEEELKSAVAKCRGDLLMKGLHLRRKALCDELTAAANGMDKQESETAKGFLAQSLELHCRLATMAMKNKMRTQNARDRFIAAVSELSTRLPEASCELLVRRAEVAERAGCVRALRAAAATLATLAPAAQGQTDAHATSHLDRDIISKREELVKLIHRTETVEKKTASVRDCLTALFNGLHDDCAQNTRQGSESVCALRKFYNEGRTKRKLQLNMNLNLSDSFSDSDLKNPKLSDELNFILKHFNLDRNRKILLFDSGESLWTFETIASAVQSVRSKWQSDHCTSVLCPSVTLARYVDTLGDVVRGRDHLQKVVRGLDQRKGERKCADVKDLKNTEQTILDQTKRRLNECIMDLEKIHSKLNTAEETLQFWSSNNLKKYISKNRTVEGMSYGEYEEIYLDFTN